LIVLFSALFWVFVSATVDLENPAPDTWTQYDNNTLNFTFTLTTTDDGLVSSAVECNLTIGGSVVFTNSSVENGTLTTMYSDTNFTLGANVWSVNCSNSTHVNNSEAKTFYFDNVNPTSVVTTANHTWFNTSTPEIFINLTDNLDDPLDFVFFADNSVDGTSGTADNNTVVSDAITGPLTNGTHTVIVEAADAAGNKINSSSITIYVDTVDPTVTLESPADNANVSAAAQTLSFNMTDNLGGPYNCSLYIDGAYNQSNASTENATSTDFSITFGDGTYNWNVSCADNASNTGASSVSTLNVDLTQPIITVNNPVPNETIVQGPTTIINVTVNGTRTGVRNTTVVLDGTTYYMGDMTCAASGSEEMVCNFTTGALSDGTHQFVVNAWDYAGAAPGNSDSTTWNFTTDSTTPSVTNNQSNITSTVGLTDSVLLNVTATDATNISSVTANGVAMGNHTATNYNLTTTATALGCTASGTCTVTFNATDYFGHSNTSMVTTFTVDAGPPSVTLVSVTNATNVSSNVQVNIQANVTDPSTVAWVRANGQAMSLLSGTTTSGMWSGNFNATDLGCSSDDTCTITINASDAKSNYNDTETTSYYVDDTAPTVTAPSVTPSEAQSTGNIDVGVVVTDVSNITSVTVNGTPMTRTGTNWNVSTTPATLSCSANTVCTLGFTATDMAGNVNNTVTTTVTVDEVAPTVTFVYNDTNLTDSAGSVTLNVTVTDTNTISTVTANGVAMSSPSSDGNYTVTDTGTNLNCVSSGPCTITFNATDTAGNSNTATTTILTIDNDGPVTTSPSVNVTESKIGDAVMIRVTATDSPAGMTGVTINGSVAMTDMGGGVYELNRTGTLIGCAANALCTIGFTATDSLGNVNNTVTTTYTTDNAAPTNTTAFSASASSTSATVAATMDEAAKCTVEYGTHTAAASYENSSSFSTSLTVALSGLSASTMYYYNITDCWDELGNSASLNYGEFNFTTSAAGSTGGGGGGGGGTYSTSSSFEFGDLTSAQASIELSKGDSMSFGHGGEDHYLEVLDLTSDYADFEVMSEPQTFRLYTGYSKDVDLDDDDKDDITVRLMAILYNKALVKINSLVGSGEKIVILPPAKKTAPVEEAPEAVETAVPEAATPATAPAPAPVEEVAPPAPEVEKRKLDSQWIIFGVLVAVIIIVLISIIIAEVRKKSRGSGGGGSEGYNERLKGL
jgi:hypothetical protein